VFAHGLNEEHLSVQGLNLIGSAPVSMETESLPSELPPTKKSVEDALPFANLKIDVDPKGDGTNYQTEIMVEIEKRSYRVIADSGATSSGVNLKLVRELDLVNSMLPTDYQYRTSSDHVEKALVTVSLALKIGPILITTPMVVMPEACGYNMLLGNEIMAALQADIMRSLKLVHFRFGNVIASVPMLPRECVFKLFLRA
jgi:predicted aspartyl protease